MKDLYEHFIFEDYQFDTDKKLLTLDYSFDRKVKFTETILFDFPFVEDYDTKALDQACFSLWVMAGISYFKAAIPPQIIIKKGSLSDTQRAFFQKIYTHGLGEFFHQNEIDPKGTINFGNTSHIPPLPGKVRRGQQKKISTSNGALIPLGGGKDSLTTIELLKSAGINFETITVDSDERFQAVSEIIGKPHIEIKRTISPELIRINKEGALNGHVPISSIWAFIFVVTAILKGKQNIILSNEHSANEATTKYMGMPVNHQYSKTLEFEKDIQVYIGENISPNIHYFSFLRPLTELNIAQIFCSKIFDKYKNNFSSCNRNFTLSTLYPLSPNRFHWCAKCPKCAFVFTILAPFLGREDLIDLFGGNLFEDSDLTETFHELLGLTESKPFECVGEVLEVRKAMIMARKKFPEIEAFLEKLNADQIQEAENFDYQKLHPHSIPPGFTELLPI